MIWLDYLGTVDDEDTNDNDIADMDTWCYSIAVEESSDND